MSRLWLLGSVLISICVIGILDYIVIVDLSLSICYLIPIAIATRYSGKRIGIFLAVISSLFWYLAESSAKVDLYYVLLIWNTLVRLVVFIVIVHLLSALTNAYNREKALASTDSLTKIYNRRYFLDVLELETKRAIRYDRCLTLVYFDVDNFKVINDRYGHQHGDKLLILIAKTVQKTIRESDLLGRLGGDEFALLLPETNYPAAHIALQRIQHQLNQAVELHNFEVSFSIGAITFTSFPENTSRMIEQVDKLMYHVKNADKNGLEHQLNESKN